MIDLHDKAVILIRMSGKKTSNPIITFLFFAMIGVAFFVLWGKQFHFDSKDGKDRETGVVQETEELYSLEPVVVELAGRYLKVEENGNSGAPRIGSKKKYLGVTVNLALKNKTVCEKLERKLPQVRDTVAEIISTKNAGDIASAEGKASLQAEIAAGLNKTLGEQGVNKVFFSDFIIQ